MIITYQSGSRDTIQISTNDNVTYRLWGTHGTKWKEWNATVDEAPNIVVLLKQFDALAQAMIEQIDANR